MELTRQLTRAFSGYSLGVALSRLFGMLRDVVLASVFGTSSSIALFMVAYRLSNLFRRLLAETPLSSSFIPLYQDMVKEDPRRAALFFRDLTLFLLLATTIGSILVISCLYGLLRFFQAGSSFYEILRLTCVMFPSLIFIVAYGVAAAYLQCHKHFFLPAVSTIFFNLCWILFAWITLACATHLSTIILALGVVLGFASQAFSVLWMSRKILSKQLSSEEMFSKRPVFSQLKCLIRPFALGTIGIAAVQINAALDSLFAHAGDPSGPAYLWYAIRIEQVPIALFAVALTTPLLSLLSKTNASGDHERGDELIADAFNKMIAMMSFSMFGLAALGDFGLNLIFGRGEFGYQSLFKTHQCLLAYSAGIVPHGLSLVSLAVLYAKKEFSIPMRISVTTVIIHLFLNTILVYVFKLGAISVALSTTISTLFQSILLKNAMQKSQIAITFAFIKHSAFGLCALGLSAGIMWPFHQKIFFNNQLLTTSQALIACCCGAFLFISVYGVLEMKFCRGEIFGLIRRKIKT